jgi:hypothetical protein
MLMQELDPELNSEIAVVGIDIGKNSFHIVGQGSARCHCATAEVVTRPGGNPARQPGAVPDRDGSLRRRASS